MPGENVFEEAVEFLLKLVQRTGHNPEHHQAQGLLARIDAIKSEAQRDYEERQLADPGAPEVRPVDGAAIADALTSHLESGGGRRLIYAIRELSAPPAVRGTERV
jgi:hypothetical protein